mgnify:CR=1 FL=1
MRFAHLSDLHLGKYLNQYSLLEDQEYIMKQILRIIQEQDIETVLIAGDVYDRPVPPGEAVALFDDFLSRLAGDQRKVFIISGNHDSPERIAFASRLIAGSGVYLSPVFHGEIRPVRLEDSYGPVNFYMLPFIRPVHARHYFPEEEIHSYTDAVRSAIAHMNVDEKERNILLAHQFVTGASRSDSEDISVGGLDNVDADVFDGFDYVALGHLHRAQNVGDQKIRYCGTPLKYSFSECRDEKTVSIVELREKGKLQVETVPLVPLRDMVEMEGKFQDVTVPSFYENVDTDAFIRMTLTDEKEVRDAFSRLRMVYPNLMAMDYKGRTYQRAQETGNPGGMASLHPSDLFCRFYQEMNGEPVGEAQTQYLQEKIGKIWEEV